MRGLTGSLAAGLCFLLRNSALRLAFLLRVEGLGFFLADAILLMSKFGTSSLVSREKLKSGPSTRENLKALPWLVSAWQKSKHLVAKEASLSPTAVIFQETSELKIIWRDQMITHASSLNAVDIVPFQNLIFLFFDSDLLFPRIPASQASFKAVLIAVYMTNGLQTKCKTCFGGPRMILHALGFFFFFFKKAV